MKTKMIDIRAVTDGLREYNARVMAEEFDEVVRQQRKRPAELAPAGERIVVDASELEALEPYNT